ncbi:MAG: LptF/LptG family permease [Candidatus Pacebacteria bacterium]|nr:LptF/LptG family permease [Candidatus Paceibacterota bacterium]
MNRTIETISKRLARIFIMPRLMRYIALRVTVISLSLLCILFAVVWLSQSLRFIDWMVNRGLPFSIFLYLSVLITPNFLTVILPIALFIAVIFAYQRLLGDSELVVAMAAGYSPIQLARPALIVGALFTVLGYFLTLWGLPVAYHAYKNTEFTMRNSYSGVLLQEGVFTALEAGKTIYIRERGANGVLYDILLSDDSTPNHSVIITAHSGSFLNTPTGPKIHLIKGNRQEWNYSNGKVGFLYFDDYTLDIQKLEAIQQLRTRVATERFVPDLFKPNDTKDESLRSIFRVEAHRRLASPLLILALVSVALVVILTNSNARVGQGRRIMVAVLAATVIEVLQNIWTQNAVKFSAIISLMYLTPILSFTLCIMLLGGFGEGWRMRAIGVKRLFAQKLLTRNRA